MMMKSLRFAILLMLACATPYGLRAATLNVPATVIAGNGLAIPTSGSGEGTLYVVGPGTAIKRKVQLGQDVQLSGDDLKNAGRYAVFLEGGDRATFFVTAGAVNTIAFLARPSRVPAATPNVIAGTAFIFDRYQNLVMQPEPIKFELTANGMNLSRTETTHDGIAYTKLDSSRKEGAAQFIASSGLSFGSARGAGGCVGSLQHPHAR